MYGLWGYLLKAKALAPINARRVLEGQWHLKSELNENEKVFEIVAKGDGYIRVSDITVQFSKS